jgi:hypothetical protein
MLNVREHLHRWQMLAPPQSLHLLLMLLCQQMPAVHSHVPLAVMLADAGSIAVLAPAPAAVFWRPPPKSLHLLLSQTYTRTHALSLSHTHTHTNTSRVVKRWRDGSERSWWGIQEKR